MHNYRSSGLRRWLRLAGKVAVAANVGVLIAGVSLPAHGTAEFSERKRRSRAVERPRMEERPRVEPRGERGHVRRRDDVVDKRTYIEKSHGWRKPE